jgi:flagellar biogenesis protein FliO
MRWAARRLLGLPATAGAGGAIQVLSRSTLSPKQQLMLIQVGRRIVLVANCGAQMNPLCEITDPEEIAGLVGQLQRRPAESAAGSFLSLFGRAGKRFNENDQEPESHIGIEEDDSPREAVEDHAALQATRHELGGLLEKVRALSRGTRQA